MKSLLDSGLCSLLKKTELEPLLVFGCFLILRLKPSLMGFKLSLKPVLKTVPVTAVVFSGHFGI